MNPTRGLAIRVHLIDGTFELFRAHYGGPASNSPGGREVGATRTLLRSIHAFLRDHEVTHVAAAFDHVIESFRNELFAGYKTGEGIDPDLWAQFPLAERAFRALGITLWPTIELEADDALATAAARFRRQREVEQILICSPDKDLAQCVRGKRVVGYDRLRERILDEDGVRQKFGVSPASIPDWLALVGDSADGIPGIRRWGPKSAARLLSSYGRLDRIPADEKEWRVEVRGAASLARTLREHLEDALLYRELATLREDAPLPETLEDLRWRGARRDLIELCEELGETRLLDAVERWAD